MKRASPHRRLRLERLSRESDVLRTWGEIAAVLQVSEWTAMEYHRRYGLPVFKPPGARNRVVTASKAQVLAWYAEHYQDLPGAAPAGVPVTSHDKLVALLKVVKDVQRRLEAARRAAAAGNTPSTALLLSTLATADDALRKAAATHAP